MMCEAEEVLLYVKDYKKLCCSMDHSRAGKSVTFGDRVRLSKQTDDRNRSSEPDGGKLDRKECFSVKKSLLEQGKASLPGI
jgi:hypothetical protein